jgi:hypothetical protein
MITSTWKKSSRSGAAGHCVEVRTHGRGEVQVRDTKLGDKSPWLIFSESDWKSFLDEIRAGIRCPHGGQITMWLGTDGMDMVDSGRGAQLSFTNAEWNAFVAGVLDGDFDLASA